MMSSFLAPIRPGWRSLGLAAFSGLLVAAGQAPLGLWWLSLPALAFVTLQVARADGRGPVIWTGWAAGAGYFAASLFWIVEPFLVEPETYGWMAPFALILMAAGGAVFWALAALAAALCPPGPRRALGFALGLAASDLLRSYVLTGFPWALVGHVWIGTPVMQVAAFAGPIGLTLVTTLAAALPAMAAHIRTRAALAVLSCVAVAGFWIGGMMREAADVAPRDPAINVRLVQPNATQALKWRSDMWDVFLRRQMEATALPADPPLDLVVWPETAVPWLLGLTGSLFQEIAAASGGVPVALGIQRADGPRYFNSLAVIDGTGSVTQVYDKAHLVPFGEYIPAGDLLASFGIRAFAAREGFGFSAGPGPRVLDLGRAGRVLPLICYEAVFPQDLRTPDRPDWVLQVTNDGWFGNLSGPYQHLAQARLRAVEQGLPLLRAANTGITAVIDARGRMLASLPLNTAGHLDAAVPPALPPTLYARTGDWPATILLICGILALFARRRRLPD